MPPPIHANAATVGFSGHAKTEYRLSQAGKSYDWNDGRRQGLPNAATGGHPARSRRKSQHSSRSFQTR
jgi:hypothetical protein